MIRIIYDIAIFSQMNWAILHEFFVLMEKCFSFFYFFFFSCHFLESFRKMPKHNNENANNENVKADRSRRNLVHKKSSMVRSGNVIAAALNEMPKVDNNNESSMTIGTGITIH